MFDSCTAKEEDASFPLTDKHCEGRERLCWTEQGTNMKATVLWKCSF